MKTIKKNISKLIWTNYIVNKLFDVILAFMIGTSGLLLILIFIMLTILDFLITGVRYATSVLWRNSRRANQTR